MIEARTPNPFDELERALLTSAEKLFAQLEQPSRSTAVWRDPKPGTPETIVTTVGFGGEHFRGNVIVASTLHVAHPLCPSNLGAVDDATACDMFGEVGNMLVGKFKNEVLRLGVTLHIGLPSTTLGPRSGAPRNAAGARWHVLELPRGPVFIRFAATFEKAFAFPHEIEKNAPIGVEGDLFFF